MLAEGWFFVALFSSIFQNFDPVRHTLSNSRQGELPESLCLGDETPVAPMDGNFWWFSNFCLEVYFRNLSTLFQVTKHQWPWMTRRVNDLSVPTVRSNFREMQTWSVIFERIPVNSLMFATSVTVASQSLQTWDATFEMFTSKFHRKLHTQYSHISWWVWYKLNN